MCVCTCVCVWERECFLHMIWSWQQESVGLLIPWAAPMVCLTSRQFSSFYVSPLHPLLPSSSPAHFTANRPGDELPRAKEDNPTKSQGQVTRLSARGKGSLPAMTSARLIMCPFSGLTYIMSAATLSWPPRDSFPMVGHGESEAIRGQSWKLHKAQLHICKLT